MTKEQEAEIRQHIETALQENVSTDFAADFALDRYYDEHSISLNRDEVHALARQYEE